MADIILGLETEYAISCVSKGRPVAHDYALRRMLDHARDHLVHLPSLHHGGFFMRRGARFYVDGGHPEWATEECTDPKTLVQAAEEGHRTLGLLASAAQSASTPETEISVFRCNVQYPGSGHNDSTHTTWASHENYSVRHKSPSEMAQQLIPFLVSRICLSGGGGFNPFANGLEFTLSPRAHHIEEVIGESSTHARPIFHLRDRPLCKGYKRVHILLGETLCSQKSVGLRSGTCAIAVSMVDAGLTPADSVQLANPIGALRLVATDTTCSKPLKLTDGREMTAIEIQRHYLEMAEAHIGDRFMPDFAEEVCVMWRDALGKLEHGPGSMADSLDWSIKFALFGNHARSLGIRWDELDCLNQVIERATKALEPLRESGKNLSVERAVTLKRAMPEQVRALEPLLHARGLGWDDVRTLLSHRQSLFELDWRVGQLRPNGIFEMLDSAGALNHRIEREENGGADNGGQAITELAGAGRAAVRSKVIQRLSGAENVQCDWQSIVDFDKGLVLDLSDPFIKEEGQWIPLTNTEIDDEQEIHILSDVLDFRRESRRSGLPNPYERRQDAADRILSGDFAGAETLLRGLLQERFILTSTHCHMARVLLMTDREPEAREHINSAWAIREHADRYVVCRILFFQCIFAMLDGAEIGPIIRQLKNALSAIGANLEWTILPMIDHLRPRLEGHYEFLTVLAEVLSGSENISALEHFRQWNEVESSRMEGAHAAD
jgi:proteasome accessory factor A